MTQCIHFYKTLLSFRQRILHFVREKGGDPTPTPFKKKNKTKQLQ
jgi:hypothetical protein